jgi:hypothetical protein
VGKEVIEVFLKICKFGFRAVVKKEGRKERGRNGTDDGFRHGNEGGYFCPTR